MKKQRITCMDFSPNAYEVASGSDDHTVSTSMTNSVLQVFEIVVANTYVRAGRAWQYSDDPKT